MSNKTIKLIKDLNLLDKVIIYGYRIGTELEAIYNSCNLGVGPLAPHRIGGKEGTGIKTKEYFAMGLPYIFSGNELLVPDGFPYISEHPDNENPIDVEKVIDFFNSIKGNSNCIETMRNFARINFNWITIFDGAIKVLN